MDPIVTVLAFGLCNMEHERRKEKSGTWNVSKMYAYSAAREISRINASLVATKLKMH